MTQKWIRTIALFLVFTSVFAPHSQAKDLLGRMGLGYNAQFSHTQQTNGVPAISFKYGFAPKMMIELIGGFYSGTGGTGVGALKFEQTIRSESYANFYYLLGAGMVSANSKSGSEFLGGLGSEFFIPGLDRIGFTFEMGLSYENLTSVTNSYVLKTYGLSFINAGMHYYF